VSCRVWGKLFEAAAAAKGDFDAASLTSFLWAANTAGVRSAAREHGGSAVAKRHVAAASGAASLNVAYAAE
jgi:hypothetical protein